MHFLKRGKVIGLHHRELFQDVSGLVARAQRKALKFAMHGTMASVPEAILANTGTMSASNVGTATKQCTALPIRKSDNYYKKSNGMTDTHGLLNLKYYLYMYY